LINDHKLERIKSCKLLGVHINEHFKWDEHIKHIASACYSTMSVLRKLKHLAPYDLRKQLAETLILSKLDFADHVYYPLPQFLLLRLQWIQFAAASFVLGRYVKDTKDVLKVGWLPISKRRDLNLLKSCFKAMYFSDTWPDYLKLEEQVSTRELCSTNLTRLIVPIENSTFQDNASKLFNTLPDTIRKCRNFKTFIKLSKEFLLKQTILSSFPFLLIDFDLFIIIYIFYFYFNLFLFSLFILSYICTCIILYSLDSFR
jgi:hypothetical protein